MSRDIDRLGKEIIERTVSALVDLVDTQRELLISQRDIITKRDDAIAKLTEHHNEVLRQRDGLREACDTYVAELKALKGAPAQDASNVALIDIAPQSIKPGDVIRFALNVRDAPEDHLVDSITQEYGDKQATFCVRARNVATGMPFLRTYKHNECILTKVVEAKGITPDDVARLEAGSPVLQTVNVEALQPRNVVIKGGFGSGTNPREVTVLYVRKHPTASAFEVGFFEPKHGRYSRRYATTARFMRVIVDGKTKVGPTA